MLLTPEVVPKANYISHMMWMLINGTIFRFPIPTVIPSKNIRELFKKKLPYLEVENKVRVKMNLTLQKEFQLLKI